MKKVKIYLKKNEKVLVEEADIASSFFDRLIGLMFRKNLPQHQGLWIKSCNSIHTCFMNFPIDVVFLSRDNKIQKIVRDIPPWRFTLPSLKSVSVIEVNGGSLPDEISLGDQIGVLCIN